MAKISLGKAFERYVADGERLRAELSAAKSAQSDAMFAVIDAEKAIERHQKFVEDPIGWVNGDELPADPHGIMVGYRNVDCATCGYSGLTPGGRCPTCDPDEKLNLLSIYNTV